MRARRASINFGCVRRRRHVGRASIPRRDVPPSPAAQPAARPAAEPARPAGKAKVGKAVGKAPPMERARTELIGPVGTDPSRPVFVDPSGVRRRRLRRLAYLLGARMVVTLALVWWSQFGGASQAPATGPCSAAATAPAADRSAPARCAR